MQIGSRMKIQELNLLLNDSSAPMSAAQEAALAEVVAQYPYFQAARALHLKALKHQDSHHYNNALKVTAAHTADREILFQYITSSDFNTEVPKPESDDRQPTAESSSNQQVLSAELAQPKTLSFGRDDRHSFAVWLQLSDRGLIKSRTAPQETTIPAEEKSPPTVQAPASRAKKQALIDQFLKANPRIAPAADLDIPAAPVSASFDPKALMTETLAQVYLEQQKYDEAIQAYKILSLKYPEKNSFFAGQIQAIKKIQKSKP